MSTKRSNLAAALLLALVILAATALAGAAPHSWWTGVASPLLLALGLVGADLLQRRSAGQRLIPSPSALILAVGFLVACGIGAPYDRHRLAETIAILGGCAAVPIIVRRDSALAACRRA